MILVPCPYCGARNSSEFRWCGEIKPRPDPGSATQKEWRDYLYMKTNAAGWIAETWYHREGCGRYFRTERNTVSNEFRAQEASRKPKVAIGSESAEPLKPTDIRR